MSLVNNSANNFKDFLDAIKPYLNYQMYDLSGQGVEANNFSTDEKVIGTWIDGKPLYQKVIEMGPLVNNTSVVVQHGISNAHIVMTQGYAYEESTNQLCELNRYDVQFSGYGTKYSVTSTKAQIYCLNDYTSYTNSWIIVKYTKTTDSPVASGEKIVGQWIDGKPVYAKTLTTEISYTGEGDVQTESIIFDGTGIDDIIDFKSISKRIVPTGSMWGINYGAYNDTTVYKQQTTARVRKLNDVFDIQYQMTFPANTTVNMITTIYYTKTTD